VLRLIPAIAIGLLAAPARAEDGVEPRTTSPALERGTVTGGGTTGRGVLLSVVVGFSLLGSVAHAQGDILGGAGRGGESRGTEVRRRGTEPAAVRGTPVARPEEGATTAPGAYEAASAAVPTPPPPGARLVRLHAAEPTRFFLDPPNPDAPFGVHVDAPPLQELCVVADRPCEVWLPPDVELAFERLSDGRRYEDRTLPAGPGHWGVSYPRRRGRRLTGAAILAALVGAATIVLATTWEFEFLKPLRVVAGVLISVGLTLGGGLLLWPARPRTEWVPQ